MGGWKQNRSMCNCSAKYAANLLDSKSFFTRLVPHFCLALAKHLFAHKRSYTIRCNALYFYFVTNMNRIGCIIICVFFSTTHTWRRYNGEAAADSVENAGNNKYPPFYLKLYCMDTKHTTHNLPTKRI